MKEVKVKVRREKEAYVVSMGGRTLVAFGGKEIQRAIDFTDGMFFAFRAVGIKMNREIHK